MCLPLFQRHGNFLLRTLRSRRQRERPKRKLRPSDLFSNVAKSLTIAASVLPPSLDLIFSMGGSIRSAVLPSIWRVVVMRCLPLNFGYPGTVDRWEHLSLANSNPARWCGKNMLWDFAWKLENNSPVIFPSLPSWNLGLARSSAQSPRRCLSSIIFVQCWQCKDLTALQLFAEECRAWWPLQ